MILSNLELKSYIEFLRNDMIQKGLSFGYNSDITILASHELDYFIFLAQSLKNKQDLLVGA